MRDHCSYFVLPSPMAEAELTRNILLAFLIEGLVDLSSMWTERMHGIRTEGERPTQSRGYLPQNTIPLESTA